MTANRGEDRLELGLMLLLALASGVAALIYEVLWLKELGRLFGVTAHAEPEDDPHLTNLSEQEVGRVLAGGALWDHAVARRAGRALEARGHLERFQRLSGMPALVAR